MRTLNGTALALALVALASSGASTAAGRGSSQGRLSGVTQITYGCPGPQRDGEACEHWSSFAHARFRLTRVDGEPAARTVTSDGRGRFTLALAVGRYRLTPLRQAQTTGGMLVPVTIQAGATTWSRIRFQGFPRML